jgi:SAM-dependent methyltransferase
MKSRYFRNLLNPVTEGLKRRLGPWRYRQHASDGVIDIDWNKIPYNRIAVVNMLCSMFETPAYLEIGCDNNRLFDAVFAARKVGVDPAKGGTLRMTSDKFFVENTETFDVIFIDGLHDYHQVHRDIENAIKSLNPGGWIALHDMLPRNWLEEHTPIINLKWSGDVWKTAFELASAERLDFALLQIDCGVGVVRPCAGAKLPDMRDKLAGKRFDYLFRHLSELPIIDWDKGRAWIEAICRQERTGRFRAGDGPGR